MLESLHAAEGGKESLHLGGGDEALRVVGKEDEGSRTGADDRDKVLPNGGGFVVGRAVPILRDAGDIGNRGRAAVAEDEVEHEVVRTVGVLVIRWVQVDEIRLRQAEGGVQALLCGDTDLALED